MSTDQPALVSDKHPIVSLLLILALAGIGFVLIGPLLGLLVASVFYNGSLMEEMAVADPDPAIAIPLLVVQGIATLVGLIIVPLVYVGMMENKPIGRFFRAENDVRIWATLAILGVGFMIVISPVVEWNMNVQFPEALKSFETWARAKEDQLIGVTKMLTSFTSLNQYILSLIVIALLPAIGEELVFRGLIQTEIRRGTGNAHLAIWAAAILFSTIHLQFFGFVPRMLLGALFGYLYWWSGNLVIPMFAHFVHNGFTLTMIYLYNIGTIDVNVDSEESAPIGMVLISLAVTSALLYYLRNYFTSRKIDKPYSEI